MQANRERESHYSVTLELCWILEDKAILHIDYQILQVALLTSTFLVITTS